METPNSFGIEGVKAGYLYGEEWLEQVIEYLDSNRHFIKTFLKDKLPEVRCNFNNIYRICLHIK